MDEVHVKEYLSKTDENFRRLAEKHQEYERELESFVEKTYLTPEERLRETELKKRKLVLKDQMHFLITQYRTQSAT